MTASVATPPAAAGGGILHHLRTLPHRLYTGEVNYDFMARRKRWYGVSAVILVVAVVAMIVRGFNYSIDFEGGSTYDLPVNGHSITQVQDAVSSAGITDATVQTIGSGSGARFHVITKKAKSTQQVNQVVDELTSKLGDTRQQIAISNVGATWGSQISHKALEGLIIFLIAVVIYISFAFREWKMAASAFVALLHDLLITAGIYALVGFEVSPSTVIAVLTILGFSLYDTVVVFDKVRENTARLATSGRATYSQRANLALNQTLLRSINTSLIALLPVAALLFVGGGLLGAGTLEDLALAQLIGLASGAYSSIFIATPLLAQLKEREPAMQQLTAKVARAEASGKTVGSASLRHEHVEGGPDEVAPEDAPGEITSSPVPGRIAPSRPAGPGAKRRRKR